MEYTGNNDRRSNSVPEAILNDLKSEIKEVSKQQINMLIEQKVQSSQFDEHKHQNKIDFQHVDESIYNHKIDTANDHKELMLKFSTLSNDVAGLKQIIWKFTGAALVIVPIVQFIANKVF